MIVGQLLFGTGDHIPLGPRDDNNQCAVFADLHAWDLSLYWKEACPSPTEFKVHAPAEPMWIGTKPDHDTFIQTDPDKIDIKRCIDGH